MAKEKVGGTVQVVEALVTPVLEDLGLRLWDVRFEKEGPDWFLRIFIDRDTPLDIAACEAATRAINPVIDQADPISQSYYLEVGGPGLGRKLTRDSHFAAKCGQKVLAHLIRANSCLLYTSSVLRWKARRPWMSAKAILMMANGRTRLSLILRLLCSRILFIRIRGCCCTCLLYTSRCV